jgi:HAD superfamily hydrolase (TIGR01509 family)
VPFLGPAIQTVPRAVIFDVGRVIIRVDLARCMGALGQSEGLSHLQVMRELEADARWPDWQEGRVSPRDWHAHLSKKLHFSYSFEEFCAIWNSVLDPQPILPDLLFERLADKCSLALLSNTDPIHVAHFEANYSFVRHFPARVYSCRVGSSKPSPMIYHHALREAAAMPDEAMFIDDLRENALAAARIGINAFHFTSADQLLAEFSRLGLWTI